MQPVAVAHILFDAYPNISGYAIRSKDIVDHQRRDGLKPYVIVSPFGNQLSSLERPGSTRVFDEITYHHLGLPVPLARPLLGLSPKLYRQVEGVCFASELVAFFKHTPPPDLIHAHSPYLVGAGARVAARRLGVPLVYEKRGIWEDTAVALGKLGDHSLLYRYHRYREFTVLQGADRVVVLSDSLRRCLVGQGIKESKIFVVPNGVDTTVFSRRRTDESLKARLGLQGMFVIGYIGSIRRIEGIALLVKAMRAIIPTRPQARLLIVGEGEERRSLEHQAEAEGLAPHVRFTGRVPHSEIGSYYSIIDLFVVPRIDARVCRLVPPLKPLEAMALGVPVLVSDLEALRELVTPGETGLVFHADDADDLTRRILLLMDSPETRKRLAGNALSWVRAQRDWSVLVTRYRELYSSLLEERRARV